MPNRRGMSRATAELPRHWSGVWSRPMKDAPLVVRDDEETVENAEGDRRHREEIHRGNNFTVIAQECHPSLCGLRTPRPFSHPAQHRSLRKIEAKHFQLTVNTRSTSGGFSATMRKISSRNSLLTHFLPEGRSMPREPGVPRQNSIRA